MNRWSVSSGVDVARRGGLALMALFVALTVIVALAPVAMAKGGGQIGESFGTAGVGNGQFFNPGLLGVDNQDGTIYTGDYNGVLTSEASNIRIQQFSAGGEFKAAAEVKRYPEPTKAIGLVGIAVDHGLERIYMVETCRVATAGGTLSCKASQGKFAAKRILVFSTKAEAGKLVPDKTLPSISLPEGAQEIYAPKAIAIDPTNNDLVILAEENAGHKIVQRVSSSGALGTRFTDTSDKLKPALGGGNGAFASTLAVSNTGVAYTLTGQKSPGSEQTRAWQLPQSLASLEEVPGFAAAAEKEGWPLGLESRVETGLGAPQLTISADGSTLYWKEYRTHSEGVEAGDLLVRGYSLSKKETTAIWGGGTSKCKITTSTSGVAAAASGNVTVFDFGAEVASVSGKPGYGLKVMTFGAGGSGCAEPVAKFTVNGKKEGEEISVKPGESVTFNAASSELLGGFRQELIWKFGDGGEKVVKGATEEAEAPTTTTYTYAAAAKVTAKLEIKLKKPPYGDPAPAERTFNVGTPAGGNKLTVTKSGTGTGTVTSSPAGINCGGDCEEEYSVATEVELTPTPAGGSTFKGWSGACTGTGSCKVTMTAAKSVNAEFAAIPSFTLKVKKGGTGTGAVTSTPAGINCDPTCEASFTEGTAVTLSGAPGANTKAVVWSGCDSIVGANECKVTMTAAKEVTATFALETRQLTVTKSGTGTGTVTSTPAGINCGPTCSFSFDHGTSVTLAGAPGANTKAVVWTGCDSVNGSNECIVAMTAVKGVTATFSLEQRQLTVTKSGTGTGTVTSSPAGINCGPTCVFSFDNGTEVTLTPAADSGSEFKEWTGACTGSGTCKVTMSAAKSVDAKFTLTPKPVTLKIKKDGTGSGAVSSTPAGINCGPTCEATFTEGTVVTLTANSSAGSKAVVWSGCGSVNGSNECVVTMSAAKEVTATFTLETRQLTVTKSGTGSGTVTSSPAGINCGPTCAASFDYGTEVTLTPAAGGGSEFKGWTGACAGAGTCKVTLTEAKSVDAEFALSGGPVSLTVKKTGSGAAPITSSPAGIDCRAVCAANFPKGTVVTLTAALGANAKAVSWSGCDEIIAPDKCKVTLNAPRQVVANLDATSCTGANITGAGSSLQAIAHNSVWKPGFEGTICNSGTHPTISYNSIGSGAGLAEWNADGVKGALNTGLAFIGTDDAPTAAQINNIKSVAGGAETAIVPVAQTAIAIVAHPPAGCSLEGVSNGDLTAAFEGRRANWSDLEGAEGSCNSPITRVVRKDVSGTTLQLKNYLFGLYKKGLFCTTGITEGKLSWQELANTAWPEACGKKALTNLIRPTGNGGAEVVKTVNATAGSIGYAALPDAKASVSGTTAVLDMQNNGQKKGGEANYAPAASGNTANCSGISYQVPKLSGRRDIDWSGVFGARPSVGGDNYPLCTLTYAVALHGYQAAGFSEGQAITVRDYLFGYIVQNSGQNAISGNYYNAIPTSADEKFDVRGAGLRAAEAISW